MNKKKLVVVKFVLQDVQMVNSGDWTAAEVVHLEVGRIQESRNAGVSWQDKCALSRAESVQHQLLFKVSES